jgi:hypothetical protein
MVMPSPSPDPSPSPSFCIDLDGAATNSNGKGCLWYTSVPYSCDDDDDDTDFSSSTMCCACGGGGDLPPTPPPSPPSPPSPLSVSSVITCSGGSYPSEVGWSLSCSDGTTLIGGAPYASSLPLAVAAGATCTLDMTDSWGDGWSGAEWSAPGFGQGFSLAAGPARSESFVVQFQPPSPPPPPPRPPPPSPPTSPPPPPPPPPSPPLHPGSQYAYSSSDFIAALNDSAVSRIVLVAGTYEFDGDMCSNGGGSALCIDRDVTIEAEVAGSVVLNAKGVRRVIYVSAAGRAELVGLNITGGNAKNVSLSP